MAAPIDSIHPLSRVAAHGDHVPSILDYLPSLDDVLHRHSEPPVCLYNYYIILRDRLELETLLDFWLDVAQADILYKRYIKYLRKASNVSKTTRKASSIMPSSPLSVHHRTSDVLTHMLLLHPRASIATTMNSNATTVASNATSMKRPPPTQLEMIELMEHIYLRYIVPNAEKELRILPTHIRENISNQFNTTQHNDEKQQLPPPENPMVFLQAKNYVHQLLESTFPLFLRYKVFMNLTLPQQIGRLAIGLILLLVGFSLEFSLIFLDIHPWQKRLWGILPIVSGVFLVVTSVTGIDPIWVLAFNLSETVPFQFNSIVHPRVKQILRKRSYAVVGIILFISFLFMVFFCSVAGKRL
ncbi:unnamed protein product [Mucor hiemalis]